MARKEVGFVVTDDYKTWIEEVKNKIRNSQIKASVRINYEMLDLYWNLGIAICEKQKQAKWGDAFLKVMSNDLQKAFPGVSGFSVENLKHIRYWYNFYTNNEKWLQGVTQIESMVKSIPWGHNQRIMYKCKDIDEALATLNKAYEALTENKKEEPTNPSDKKDESTNKKDETVKTETKKNTQKSKVKTGDNTAITAFAVMMFISGCVFVLARRKRND